jgi:hypothetical protein
LALKCLNVPGGRGVIPEVEVAIRCWLFVELRTCAVDSVALDLQRVFGDHTNEVEEGMPVSRSGLYKSSNTHFLELNGTNLYSKNNI